MPCRSDVGFYCSLLRGALCGPGLRELRRSDIELGRDDDGDAFGWVHVRRAVVLARTGERSVGAVPPPSWAGRRPMRA